MQTQTEIQLKETDAAIIYEIEYDYIEGYNSRGSFPFLIVTSIKDENGWECVNMMSDEAMELIEQACEKQTVIDDRDRRRPLKEMMKRKFCC